MENKKQCGACELVINDLEPLRCGFCETLFHISQQCCGINLRPCRDIFAQGKVLFICPECRSLLNGRSIRAYMADLDSSQSNSTNGFATQLQQLSGLVEALSKKVDNISSASTQNKYSAASPLLGVPSESGTGVWPRLSAKRRRGDYDQSTRPASNKGTKAIDFENLSVPFIMPAAPKPVFWLYLSGFQPLISDDDVEKIVSRCLDINDPINVTRLVPKGKDVSQMTFLSFKIGLDPSIKQQALNAEIWPAGLMFREFMDQPKNPIRPMNIATRQ
ncbi:uncharacterized protein LOC129729247 [Wyeomyia smithii]|uniref:uncharacterized protein LOC129729247 n=1 Tax=Wyeomyia smithii TaxID=174621 RepID=UPI002467EADF|nr:uncharacterized protein LOC129729247 [Wyeomyia smithii]